MSYLTKEGLQYALGRVKTEIDKSKQEALEQANAATHDIANRQKTWDIVDANLGILETDGPNCVMLDAYKISKVPSYANDSSLLFMGSSGYSYLPAKFQEYIITGLGSVLKNLSWPHITQMPWPGSAIPDFKEGSEYTIHITNGEVVSCIEKPEYAFSVIIEANIPESFVGKTVFMLNIKDATSRYINAVYVDDVLQDGSSKTHAVFTKSGPATIRLEFSHALDVFEISCSSSSIALRSAITKIDLSQLNPDCAINMQNLYEDGKQVTHSMEVVFPKAMALAYKNTGFYISSAPLENFNMDHMRVTKLYSCYLSYLDVRSLKNEVFNAPLPYDSTRTLTFKYSSTANSILRKMANAFIAKGWKLDHESFIDCKNLEQAGSVYNPWYFGSYVPFRKCTALKFASIEHDDFEQVFEAQYNSELKEVIFNANHGNSGTNGPCSTVSAIPDQFPKLDILVLNMPWYRLPEHTSWGFNATHPTKVYIPMYWDAATTNQLQEQLPAAWTLYRFENLDEIPFQYAPED